eukprot:CAMPEP_0113542244 /NCGR_PEP_ID=MMETSP0015_2-20120614/9495_1 /TAXON_ID=2838 /ORGANISM="Odontella" /LENGTH=1078 /DNA_ID=CAMNT_0000442271 /DNA_START=104 /DNA_END=3343 /DNA_ORIENTATION=- /assembly_acc=CAM_ASM_000160
MTRIAQIEDHGSAVAWSPVKSDADVIALGAKDSGGVGFDDYGGELELFNLNICSPQGQPKPRPIGSVKTTSRFSSIGWTAGSGAVADKYKMGLIAGGMIDGSVNVWDPATIKSTSPGKDPTVATVKRHSGGAVSALQFNPHPASANLLASGGSDGEVLVTSLENPKAPHVYVPATDQPKQGAEITQVAWNTQVSHILASSAGNGTAVVWDLRQKKPWCELRCEANAAVSDLQWNPTQGLHIVTSSSDDRNPVLKLWDLRASTTMPLTTLEGHSQGILSLSWCPHDDSLLVSCGKDNRTILWDLFTLKSIGDIPNDEAGDTPASATYGGISQSQQKRYDVQWSPILRGVVSTCSFDRKVQAHSMIGLATKCGRPPQWLKPSSAVTCGFGGTIVSLSATSKSVSITSCIEEPELKAASEKFEELTANGDYTGFCQSMADTAKRAGDSYENKVWGFMKIIFEENARAQLLTYLGFDSEKISRAATEFVDNSSSLSDGVSALSIDSKGTPAMAPEAEAAVQQALLVGNFEAAVECCFRSGNLADALVLASCGGAELWAKTQAEYFSREAKKRPFLSIVSAVMNNKLEELVSSSDPKKWQETLAILSTYGKSDEFPSLCLALGNRLEEAGDAPNASLCFMCGLKLDKAVKYWKFELEQANKAKGTTDLLALHAFIEKVTVYLQALDNNTVLDSDVSELFFAYAKALSDQGLFAIASKYCRSESQKCKELKDRLYRSKDSHYCLQAMGGSPPEFPYSSKSVGVAPARASSVSLASTSQSAQVSQQQKQHPATTTSQQYQQQHTTASNAQQQQQTTTSTHSASQEQIAQSGQSQQLPPGWVALQDSSSGKTYYANQSTGESSWEMPKAVQTTQAQQPSAYANGGTSYQQTQSAQQPAAAAGTKTSPPNASTPSSKVASKYGDGFVTSASHPELAERYGNTGTSSAYLGVARPGTAAVGEFAAPSPAAESFDPNKPPDVSAEHKPIVDGLLAYVNALKGYPLSVSEKKQLAEIEKGVGIFTIKLSRSEIDANTASQVGNLVTALNSRDYVTAGKIQAALVNSDWRTHKDWLKGAKFLIQLANKKFR